MASRVAAIVKSLHRLGQSCESPLRHRQRVHLRRHIPVSEFIGQHDIRLRPHRQHRLIATLAFIGGQGFPLPALDDRRVLIDGGDLLLRRALPQSLHQVSVHLPQPLQGLILLGNVGLFFGPPSSLRLFDLLLVMKLIEKLQRR
jgi:hypothetical protein